MQDFMSPETSQRNKNDIHPPVDPYAQINVALATHIFAVVDSSANKFC